MRTNIVFTFLGEDQPGLVDRIAEVVEEHEGNWLASRLSCLAGKFAGIIQVGVEEARAKQLAEAIRGLGSDGLSVVVEASDSLPEAGPSTVMHLEVFGLDRCGIVHEISHALATHGINVIELSTEISPAAMTGEIMFVAEATIEVPEGVDVENLQDQLDAIGQELTVDVDLVQSEA